MDIRALLALLFTVAVWGVGPVFIRTLSVDLGPADHQSVDYPDYAAAVARGVAAGDADLGVLLCGSGIGMSIAANKVAGIRAALVHDVTGAALSRQHNNANVLVLGGGMLGERLIREIVRTWVNSRFEGGRHQRRVDKITHLEHADTKDDQA